MQVDFYFEADYSQEMQHLQLAPLTFNKNTSTEQKTDTRSILYMFGSNVQEGAAHLELCEVTTLFPSLTLR